MILIVKNTARNEEMQYKINDWSDLDQIIERYPSIDRMLDKAKDFDDAKNILLRYFNSSTNLAAHFNKEKPLIKAQIQIPKTIDFSFNFYQWLEYRAREQQKEHIIIDEAHESNPIEETSTKPSLLDKIKGMFGL